MADIGLIITSLLFAILVIIGALYFVVYFQHPNDKWTAWFPKVVVILSLSLAAWNVFLLPLDVANQQGSTGAATGGIPTATLTIAFYATSIAVVLVVMPFTVFYYEGEDAKDDPDGSSRSSAGQLGYAIKWIIPTLMMMGGIVAGMYLGGLGYADIQTTYLQSPLFDTTDLEAESLAGFYTFAFYCNTTAIGSTIPLTPRTPLGVNQSAPVFVVSALTGTDKPGYGCKSLVSSPICCSLSATNQVVVSIGVFIVAIVTLLGWVIFAAFGGVGMAAMPYDLLQEFQHRPKPITSAEYAERKVKIGQQAQLLMEVCKTLSQELKEAARSNSFNRRYRTVKNRERQFRKDVLILDYHYRKLEESYRFQGGNILLQYIKFICGCLSSVLTLLWLVHIGLYVIPVLLQQRGQAINPVTPFLNDMLKMTQGIPVIGIVLYAVFTFYLLFCVLKGNAKLGMRLIFITVHPLNVGETLMSSLVFNAGVILLCSLPLAQFCNIAFADYAKYTSNQSIFGVSIASLKGISFGYDACVYLMLFFCVATFFYNMYNPYKKQKENQLKFNW
ncbi:hypothetical protein BC831DRAFT_451739 [Entophlyctis helioformis]|nr:hypothetical protein BC831DRAFT_451739 [Entophlyctis helioformis]